MSTILQDIISDAEVIRVHGSANFGNMTPREVIADGVSKYAIGYTGGSTQLAILYEHGLITKPKGYRASLTQKGKLYARAIVNSMDIARVIQVTLEVAAKSLEYVATTWEEEEHPSSTVSYRKSALTYAKVIRALASDPQTITNITNQI